MTDEIHPEFHRMLGRADKERVLGQRGIVAWLYGLSGSGKSTVANALERRLHAEGRYTVILDGDNIRSGLNADLGFSDEDRRENIRRIAEVARLFLDTGAITIVSFITPRREFRAAARARVGAADFLEVYVRASFETCAERDPKGLYQRASGGSVKHFTGTPASSFEEPEAADRVLDTEALSLEACVETLYQALRPRFNAVPQAVDDREP